ncbi:MAG: hydroxyethylthiazole kinase [Candidatus Competibacteraceae bacterium]|jgi:hydroxyethylthiazole kinase|nr:hydroxyethylthiazole kinase [Candidatus Competibacteraceae bacterium]
MNYARAAAASLRTLTEHAPRVHCITNLAASAYTANLLLAVGAIPSLSLSPTELASFVGRADGLCINLGTLDEQRRQAIGLALETAAIYGKPWVLDPVLVDVSPERCRYAQTLLAQGPTIIRGNRAEIEALAEREEQAAEQLAIKCNAVVAQTGSVDLITDGYRRIEIANGHPLMSRVTGLGCAGSALIAAFLAVVEDGYAAATQALLSLGVAGEQAALQVTGPGSFQWAILDELYRLDESLLEQQGKVREIALG